MTLSLLNNEVFSESTESTLHFHKQIKDIAHEMAQQVKAVAAKPDSLSRSLRILMVKTELTAASCALLSVMHCGMHMHRQTENK